LGCGIQRPRRRRARGGDDSLNEGEPRRRGRGMVIAAALLSPPRFDRLLARGGGLGSCAPASSWRQPWRLSLSGLVGAPAPGPGPCGTARVIVSVCAAWVALAFLGFFWAVGFELALGTEPDLLLGGRAGNRWSLASSWSGLTGSRPSEAFASCTAVLFFFSTKGKSLPYYKAPFVQGHTGSVSRTNLSSIRPGSYRFSFTN
jgi:hypothetical protein